MDDDPLDSLISRVEAFFKETDLNTNDNDNISDLNIDLSDNYNISNDTSNINSVVSNLDIGEKSHIGSNKQIKSIYSWSDEDNDSSNAASPKIDDNSPFISPITTNVKYSQNLDDYSPFNSPIISNIKTSMGKETPDSPSDNINNILEEIQSENKSQDFTYQIDHKSRLKLYEVRPVSSNGGVCFPALAGGTNNHQNKQTCKKLRCNECAHIVIQLEDKAWDNDVDYLFFRKNMPNIEKLSAKIHKCMGSYAYACQCHWLSINSILKLPSSSHNMWVCAGHD